MTQTPTPPPTDAMDPIDRALVEEAAKKSALVWVQGSEGAARALWHIWHEGAVCLVGDGPDEQPLKGLGLVDGGTATVTVRSKDKGGRLVGWPARVVELTPDGEAWTAAVGELKGKRLNAADADTIAERWARECRVLRLEPVTDAALVAAETGSLAAAPLPTAAVTRRAMPAGLPKLIARGKRARAAG
ncbi:hypothetical protein ACFZCY_09745 [Streptomyces sp. NPDC007983]|uniref:hypothetical protein n=1 Tax=Streptomyces sp. NPDC007983 TaxID=3364800 RepID=UPI0036E4BA6C